MISQGIFPQAPGNLLLLTYPGAENPAAGGCSYGISAEDMRARQNLCNTAIGGCSVVCSRIVTVRAFRQCRARARVVMRGCSLIERPCEVLIVRSTLLPKMLWRNPAGGDSLSQRSERSGSRLQESGASTRFWRIGAGEPAAWNPPCRDGHAIDCCRRMPVRRDWARGAHPCRMERLASFDAPRTGRDRPRGRPSAVPEGGESAHAR